MKPKQRKDKLIENEENGFNYLPLWKIFSFDMESGPSYPSLICHFFANEDFFKLENEFVATRRDEQQHNKLTSGVTDGSNK